MKGMRAWKCLLALCAGSAVMAEAQTARAQDGVVQERMRGEPALPDPPAAAVNDLPALAPPLGSETCSDLAVKRRGLRMRRALDGGFGVQYWGEGYSAEGLAVQPHGLLIIEAAKLGAQYSDTGQEVFFTPEELTRISQDGARPVLGYLNVGEIETYRDYWIDAFGAEGAAMPDPHPVWFGPHHGPDDLLAAYWVREWGDLLLARVDRLMQSGADGVFLDDVLQYFTHTDVTGLDWPGGVRPDGPRTAPELARAMMHLVTRIASRVRVWDCDALVVVNNAAFIGRDAAEAAEADGSTPIFDAYRAAIDGIMAENALVSAEHATTRTVLTEDYLDVGLPVMTLDVMPDHGEEDFDGRRQVLASRAREAGFAPYLVEDATFNRLAAPVVPAGKS